MIYNEGYETNYYDKTARVGAEKIEIRQAWTFNKYYINLRQVFDDAREIHLFIFIHCLNLIL